MTARPTVKVPLPATDENYPAGGDAWSSQPIKVDPGVSTLAAGKTPNKKLPAIWQNFIEHAFGQYLDYLADIQLLNWLPAVAPGAAMRDACFDNGTLAWVAVGDDSGSATSARYSTDGGQNWTNISPGTGFDLRWVASKDKDVATTHTSDFLIAGDPGSNAVYQRRSGSWTSTTLPAGTDHSTDGVYDPVSKRWIVVGENGGVNNEIFYSQQYTSDGVLPLTWTAVTPTSTYGGPAVAVATDGAGNTVVMGPGNSSSAAESYVSSDGTTWNHYTNSIVDPVALAWDAARDQWVCVTLTGGVYTSADGASWSSAAALTLSASVTVRSLVCVGNLVAFMMGDVLIYSRDLTTWRQLELVAMSGQKLRYSHEREQFMLIPEDVDSSAVSIQCGLPEIIT